MRYKPRVDNVEPFSIPSTLDQTIALLVGPSILNGRLNNKLTAYQRATCERSNRMIDLFEYLNQI